MPTLPPPPPPRPLPAAATRSYVDGAEGLGGGEDGATAGAGGSRSRHVVDRALEYRALARQGWSATAIRKRKRKSKAYVSILLRFGELIEQATALEVAVLRHRAVTYKLLQQIVRADADERTIFRKLRSAVASPRPDGRRRRRLKLPPAPAAADPDLFAFRWDPAWAARDPLGYLDALAAYLRRVQRGVDHRLRQQLWSPVPAPASPQARATGTTVTSVARAGGSIRAMVAAMGRTSPAAPAYTPVPAPHTDGAGGRAVQRRLAELDAVLRQLEGRAPVAVGEDEIGS